MFTRGEFTSNNVTYGVIMSYTKACIEAILVTSGTVVSAYKTDATGSYSYNNVRAKELVQLIKNGVKGCTSKNGTPMPFELGAMTQHEFTKTKVEYIMQMHKGEVVGAYIQSGDKRVELAYNDQCEIPANIPYIKLTEVQVKKELDVAEDDLDAVPVRSVQEIALEKDDLTWLQNKKYYIVNDDETAEKLFTFLDNYNGAIAYDTETTGLRINCFGKINSEYSKSLQKYNEEHPDEQIRSDRLVGIIFCVENDTSYYFPCFNRKFKNLYQDVDSPIRNRIINNIKARYTIGDRKDSDGDMKDYVLNTPADQFRLDVILMERVRDILHTKHIVAHNGTFEWKVGWQYEIDTNLTDDTMIMHQLMYKFRSTTSNRGEPSNLKYLAKRELGIDQWELSDFFPDWKADSTGTVRTKAGAKTKKSGSRIDFSYMDYEGTRVYAPTDGDVTFLLYNLYKKDMKKNHADMEYIYSVEIIVSCAIAYMEFYGHRLDESKILGAREQTRANIAMIVSEIRQLISYSNNDEVIAYNNLKQLRKDIDAAKGDEKAALEAKLPDMVNSLNSAIDANTDKVINLASPAQVCDLFYNKMKIPVPGDKQSVAKKEIKALLKEKDENGKDKYPIVHMYSKYKNEDTLMTKFFDNLPYFMYPGGYIFSSFGQISTATGRMSCIDENSLITTVGGYKKIKDMQVGDLVYCYDEEGNLRIKKVLNVMDKGMKECVKLHWESTGTHTSGELICTPDHKILSKNSGWVRADSLSYNEPVYHLRRSSEDRPRLYGTNGICEQEQLVIKKEIFKTDDYNIVIHHKDEVTTNNDLSNLELKTRKEHSSEHSKELASQGRLKYEHLAEYARSGEFMLRGEEHPCYIKKSAEELEQMLIDAEYIVTKIPMDFSTYVKKCEEAGFDYKDALAKNRKEFKEVDREEFVNTYNKHNGTVYAIAKDLGIGRARVATLIRQYGLEASIENIDDEAYITIFKQCNGDVNKMQNECESIGVKLTTSEIRKNNTRLGLVSIGVDDDTFTDVFLNNKGSIRATAKELGISFYKASCTVKRLNLCYNHKIVGIENVGIHHVYDLEVEDCHNFIANEICVHNCSHPNAQQYPKVITKIVSPRPGFVMMDADYSQIEYRVLTALAKNTELAKLFSHPDSDYHTLMASLMYSVPYASVTPQMRSAAKSFNFGIPYGMGIKSLSILLNGKSDKKSCDEAMEKYELYFKNQPRTRKFFDDIKEMAQVNGYTKTLFNRYRYYSFTDKDGNVNNGKRAAALRQAGNAVIQGCLDGDTRIQTKELGIVKIKDAVNTHLHVWDGKEWADGDVLYSGKKQKCIITFSNGQKFICSPIHKFLVRSAKGNDRFVECKDLATKQNSKNPHRIVVNPEYVKSDYTYSSEWAYKYDVNNNNAHNTHLDHIYDSFDAGVLLGRLASDGTISKREQGASFILNYIAEHEMNIAPELRRCMEMLGDVKESNYHRPDRNEDMHRMYIYSASLVGEVQELDVKHKIHDFIFNDTEMLRGFLRGMFDGDGGVSGKTITLTFGTQYDFTNMCDDIQKALLFFGIRSRTYKFEDRYKVTIKTNDNSRFMELIGFINEDKNEAANSLECIRDGHLFGRILIPESVEITDEYIDMYDVCNTTNGYYVADGIVTHNTAADIFKIGVARNFSFIRRNNLFGKMLIINMIHDEQLMEVDVQHLNMQRILAEVGKNMQFHIDGFPPLYIGAGIGKAWGYAKGKMAEIHPNLLEEFTEEARNIPIWRTEEEIKEKPYVDPQEVLNYFDSRVYEFRRKKVADYLADPANWHQDIHPAIGGLINLQFNYGRGDDAKAYTGPNGEKYNDTEFLLLNIADFLKENNIDAKPEYFTVQEQQKEVEEDNSYDDSDEEEPNVDDMVDDSAEPQIFSKIDESNKLFGASLHDYIGIFGTCILERSRVCGIDTRNLHFRKRDAIIAYLMNYICDEDDPDGNQIVFLTDGNILKYTGIYVKGLKASELEANYKIFLNNSKAVKGDDSDYQNGDIDNRSQAK